MKSALREVHTVDVIDWFRDQPPLESCSIIASMPDFSEFPQFSLTEWKEWFRSTAELLMTRAPENGVVLFFQTDVKLDDGTWLNKAFLCQQAAEKAGSLLLFHKVICRAAPDRPTFGKPAYSHLLAFSKGIRDKVENATADVISQMGERTWPRGMGLNATRIAIEYIKTHTTSGTIIHPFCGEGVVLAVANAMGLNAIGIEKSKKRAEKALRLQVYPSQTSKDGFRFEP
jgi:hypothetical protein